MTDQRPANSPVTTAVNLQNACLGVLMLTLPYLFLWQLVTGIDFFEALQWYIRTALYAVSIVAVLILVVLAVQRRWPAMFETPPTIPNWSVVAGIIGSIALTLIVGWLDGWVTSLLLFWPSLTISASLVHGLNWCVHQVKRWRS